MNFGEGWYVYIPLKFGNPANLKHRKAALGECSKENSFKILDTYYSNGGNFIDT
jgi:aryl-alcohol dehydrogenase-like predicted oxidoreductase